MTMAVIVDACGAGEGMLAARLGAESALRLLLERCARVPGVSALACIMPDDSRFEAAAGEAEHSDALVMRGDPADALGLCARAASEAGAEAVMRVPANQPFFDPALGARVHELLSEANADYSCNDLPASWPEGLECEVFAARLLHWADALADHPRDREKVTSWMRANTDLRKACLTGPGGDFAHMRWSLDSGADLAFARALFEHMGARAAAAGAAEIAAFCLRRPDVTDLNTAPRPARRTLAWRADIETAPMPLGALA